LDAKDFGLLKLNINIALRQFNSKSFTLKKLIKMIFPVLKKLMKINIIKILQR
jgi:hypothetical protein